MMRRRVAAVLLALVGGLLSLSLPAAAADQPYPVAISLDRAEVAAGPGQKVRFTSLLRNTGEQPLTDVVVHLAILTSDADVYVDPEDWSPRRTQYVDELAPGEEVRLDWDVRAVTSGPLLLHVTAMDPASASVGASEPLRMTVGGRREVNAERAGPLVVGVPASLLMLLVLTGARRRSRR